MKSPTEISGSIYKLILNANIGCQNLGMYHVLHCRKRLAGAKMMKQIKHCHRNNTEPFLEIAEKKKKKQK